LDDAFRQYLNERGAKPVALPDITHLVTGSAEVRLVARTLAALPEPPAPRGAPPPVALGHARHDVTAAFAAVEGWFDASAEALREHPVRLPAVEAAGTSLRPVLLAAVDEVRRSEHAGALPVALRLLWLSERLDELRGVQAQLSVVCPRI
jgi:hypothetical protein